ncbi:hypothetical protein OCH239_16750 [Roseivivax halodurans JCM 10272]|uniref:Uncharacterized protein n=1 Tax=Roseivivax halodurans JCM 10272 TaxID=1449350 RepID=X7EHX0_9RHOB|nr:hypothetical protein OCH239_16750 [Roseivivax halodurans JCM 10272]
MNWRSLCRDFLRHSASAGPLIAARDAAEDETDMIEGTHPHQRLERPGPEYQVLPALR